MGSFHHVSISVIDFLSVSALFDLSVTIDTIDHCILIDVETLSQNLWDHPKLVLLVHGNSYVSPFTNIKF